MVLTNFWVNGWRVRVCVSCKTLPPPPIQLIIEIAETRSMVTGACLLLQFFDMVLINFSISHTPFWALPPPRLAQYFLIISTSVTIPNLARTLSGRKIIYMTESFLQHPLEATACFLQHWKQKSNSREREREREKENCKQRLMCLQLSFFLWRRPAKLQTVGPLHYQASLGK